MSTLPTFVLEERLPGSGQALNFGLEYPHNYGTALRLFENLVRADAISDQAFGPHTGHRLVLTQAGPAWRPAKLCRHCGEAIWQAGAQPGRGIWMHMYREPELGFVGMCAAAGGRRAEPGIAVGPQVAGDVDAGPRRQLPLLAQDGAR